MDKSSLYRSPVSRVFAAVGILVLAGILVPPSLVAPNRSAVASEPILLPVSDVSSDRPCVLLRNGNVLYGSADQIGEMVCITRDDKTTISLPTSQVESIGKSLHELYQHRCRNRFPDDLKRLQSDVRWSLRNGLLTEAASDVLHARKLDPANAQTIQLLRQVAARMKQQSIPEAISNGVPRNAVAMNADMSRDPAVQTVSHESPQTTPNLDQQPNGDDQPIGLSERSTYEFAAKIQPILMNRCVSCHARDDDNDRVFKIHSSLTSRWAPKIVADENLRAVMQFVDSNYPGNSLIRTKASDGHGGRRDSFGSPGSAMMTNLDRWLSQLQTTSGQSSGGQNGNRRNANQPTPWSEVLDQHEPAGAALSPTHPPELSPVMTNQSVVASGIPELPEPIESRPASWMSNETKPDPPRQMRRMPKVKNPFDPEIFNRRFHGP